MPEVPLEAAESAFDLLLRGTILSAQYELPQRVAEAGALLEARDALIHLADLQQTTLAPFLAEGMGVGVTAEKLRIDGTVAGRAFQNVEILTQSTGGGAVRVWLPLSNGTERLGVLGVTVDSHRLGQLDGLFGIRLRRFAALVSLLLTTKTMFGDSIARLRRNSEMGLAAELQWSLLPPLTFASRDVTIAGALEPAYRVAGDTLDYAVDAGIACAAIFDGMGHGLRSSQLAAIAIAGYRNARRASLSLVDTAAAIHTALVDSFDGNVYTTGVMCELNTTTGIFSWVNSGHPYPLLLRDGRLVKTLSCPPAPPMGLAFPVGHERPPFVVCHEQLEPEDRILLFTDGVTEARSPDGEFFGDARLADLLTRHFAARLPTPETLRRVVRALLEHQQGQLNDDATLLLVEWRSDPGSLMS
ncbi:MAG: protein serine/threonine phosphatase [Pseudonocardiales bacterium]|nr:protein serine/threonine phosphatase [Pseudonocardiales bacterium]